MAMVAIYCNCRALCRLGSVSRRFRHIPSTEQLWKLRALDILPCPAQLESAKSALNLGTYRQFVEAFTRIGIPCGVLGFWRADARTTGEAERRPAAGTGATVTGSAAAAEAEETAEGHGELLRISLSGGGFLGESISPTGSCRG